MIEAIVLGTIQGITEWLPVSSEGAVIIFKNLFFQDNSTFEGLIKLSLFLHLGTALAVSIYFYKDLKEIIKGFFQFEITEKSNQQLIMFLLISTAISGAIGGVLLLVIKNVIDNEEQDGVGAPLMLVTGFALILTAYLQHKKKVSGERHIKDISINDSLMVGFVQGFSIIPGLSRSGVTTAFLLMTRFSNKDALKISFLMGLPLVIASNIVLNYDMISKVSFNSIVALMFAFVLGIITIHWFLKIAEKLNFSKFVLLVACITIASGFYSLIN